MTDVIQQLLELSEQVSGETAQPQPSEPAIAMETAINQDILQVSEGHSPTLRKLDDENKTQWYSEPHRLAGNDMPQI